MGRKILSTEIAGPSGRLEALLEEPALAVPTEAALLCHPHPLHGGTMRNKVVHRMARGLSRAGAAVLRFNFRGVGRSEGAYGHFEGEMADARSALEWLRDRYPHLPCTLAGFSFGARIVERLACEQPETARVILAGYPTVYSPGPALARCSAPRIYIQSTQDEFGPRQDLEAYVSSLQGSVRVLWVEASGHFFAGGLDQLEELLARLAR